MNKQPTCRTVFLLLFAIQGYALPQDLMAQGYVMFSGGGGGGAAHAASGGVEFGKLFPRENPRFLLGGDLSVATNGYPAERSEFFQTDVRNEQQIGAVAGLRVVRGVYLVGTGGLSERAERDYMIVNGKRILLAEVPGKTYGSGSGQLRFVYKRFVFGVGYHSRRGVVVGLGFTFSKAGRPRRIPRHDWKPHSAQARGGEIEGTGAREINSFPLRDSRPSGVPVSARRPEINTGGGGS